MCTADYRESIAWVRGSVKLDNEAKQSGATLSIVVRPAGSAQSCGVLRASAQRLYRYSIDMVLLIVALSSIVAPSAPSAPPTWPVYDVRAFGAVSDGNTDCTSAFRKIALRQADHDPHGTPCIACTHC